jgi:hypothetical protein
LEFANLIRDDAHKSIYRNGGHRGCLLLGIIARLRFSLENAACFIDRIVEAAIFIMPRTKVSLPLLHLTQIDVLLTE